MSSNEEASVHSRTLTHYKNFVAIVKMKVNLLLSFSYELNVLWYNVYSV